MKHAKSNEVAIRDQSYLENKHPVETAFAAHQSVYQRQRNSISYKSYPIKLKTRIGCGSNQHKYNQSERSTKCAAWGQTFKNCVILNHYARIYLRHNDKSKVNNIHLIAHVNYDTIHDTYIPSSNSEGLQATIIVKTPDRVRSQQATVWIFSGSGASMCLAGPQYLIAMGITESSLNHATNQSQQ